MTVRWIAVGVVLLAAAVAAAWNFRQRLDVKVTTAPVTVGAIVREVVAAGTVEAESSVQVGTQVSGVVQTLNADFNSAVHRGDVIARLDPTQYDEQLKEARAAKEQAEADVESFRVDVEDARQKLSRAESLAKSQLIPPSDLETARATFEEAQASLHSGEAALRQAAAAVNQASVDLEHTIIRAPAAGIVVDRKVDVGQTVAASVETPVLFTIAADLDTVQLQVEVDEADVGWIMPGDTAVFAVDAYPHEVYHGTVSQVREQPIVTPAGATDPRADTHQATTQTGSSAGVVSYTAVLDVPNPGDHLLPGMTAVVTIDGAHRDRAIRIPNSALVFRPTPEVLRTIGATPAPPAIEGGRENRDVREVWKYDGERLTPVVVRAGLADDDWTEVVSGSLSAGDQLVTDATISERRPRLLSGL